jgi:hypothetical protein
MVTTSNTRIDPNTVVVTARYTPLADLAVFASRWFEEEAGSAFLVWEVDNVVIRVFSHRYAVIRV